MRQILLLAVWLSAINLFAQFPTTSLTVSYPFNNGSTNDLSGNNNNLTAFNGPTPCSDRFNNPNCAYLFDGVDDYMKAINPGPMNHKSRSIVFWAKMSTPFNSNGFAVLHYGDGSIGGGRVEYGLNSTCNSFYIDYGYGFASVPFATTDNMWHMYAAVYDSTISYGITSVKYYVDANLIGTTCYTYNPSQTVNTKPLDPINIGRFNTSLPRYFTGALDDIHVWARPLTPGEIVTIFTLPNSFEETRLDISDISVFPNPAKDRVEIRGFKEADIFVFNALGQKVVEETNVSTKLSINLAALQKGIYFIRVSNSNGSVTRKIVRE
jgi:hypothetical protein